jgi:hypothetical protein
MIFYFLRRNLYSINLLKCLKKCKQNDFLEHINILDLCFVPPL